MQMTLQMRALSLTLVRMESTRVILRQDEIAITAVRQDTQISTKKESALGRSITIRVAADIHNTTTMATTSTSPDPMSLAEVCDRVIATLMQRQTGLMAAAAAAAAMTETEGEARGDDRGGSETDQVVTGAATTAHQELSGNTPRQRTERNRTQRTAALGTATITSS